MLDAIYAVWLQRTLQLITIYSSSVPMSSLTCMLELMNTAVYCLFIFKDVLLSTFAYNFFVLSLRADNVGTQYSKCSLIIISLQFLSAKSDYACPKNSQRQMLLNIIIRSIVALRTQIECVSGKRFFFSPCLPTVLLANS